MIVMLTSLHTPPHSKNIGSSGSRAEVGSKVIMNLEVEVQASARWVIQYGVEEITWQHRSQVSS